MLTKQIKLIKSQGESLGLDTTIPAWMEQSLLLIAAWQNPAYNKIALEYSTKSKTFSVEALVRELRNQNLVTGHLDKAGERQNKRDDVHVKAAKEAMPKYCYSFQKGNCTRNECPFLHEKEKQESKSNSNKSAKKPEKQKPANTSGNGGPAHPPLAKQCYKCGAAHNTRECTFAGECGWCHKKGHKESVCQGKVRAAVANDTSTTIVRVCTVMDDDGGALEHDGFMESDSDDDYDYMEHGGTPSTPHTLLEHDCNIMCEDEENHLSLDGPMSTCSLNKSLVRQIS